MNKGFTLIETLVAIFIFVTITTALFSIIPSLYQADRYALQQTQAVDEARRGMKIMLREIREASPGQDGSYMIKSASDNELVFFSDIDQDDQTERVRYFLGDSSSSEDEQECVIYRGGGSCHIIFDDFSSGEISNAQLRIGAEGDLGSFYESISAYADGHYLSGICGAACQDCAGYFQDYHIYDVNEYVQDGMLDVFVQTNHYVDPFCDWKYENHGAIIDVILTWDQESSGNDQKLQKGVIEPTEDPVPEYVLEDEQISILSHYIQNKVDTPQKGLFYYYDQDGNEISDPQSNLEKISLVKLKLIVNVNSSAKPDDYYLESKVKLRELRLDDE